MKLLGVLLGAVPFLILLGAVVLSTGAELRDPPVAQATHAGNQFDCSDFATQADAQAHYRLHPTDPDQLDVDVDGIACEDVAPCPCDLVPLGQATPTPSPTAAPTATGTASPTLAAGTATPTGTATRTPTPAQPAAAPQTGGEPGNGSNTLLLTLILGGAAIIGVGGVYAGKQALDRRS
jgi:hypothetical protein